MRDNVLFYFNIVAGVASIVSVIYIAFADETKAIIALLCFCLFLLASLIALICGISKYIERENMSDNKKVSVFTTFETIDSSHCQFETYRVIQAKRLILTSITQSFKWTGARLPQLSSRLQTISDVKQKDATEYDTAVLKFKHPLRYNETTTIHFKAEMDDYDSPMVQPHLDYRVDSDINIIHFRVILRHKKSTFKSAAKLLRMPTESANPAHYEEIGSVVFDVASKSYNYHLTHPDVGYYYRIQWEK